MVVKLDSLIETGTQIVAVWARAAYT